MAETQTLELQIGEKRFCDRGLSRIVLKDITVSLRSSARWGLMGASGIGKTTLFRILAGLDNDFEGSCTFYRNGTPSAPRLGFVFQDRRIFPWLTAEENIALPLLSGPDRQSAMVEAVNHSVVRSLVARLGLIDRRKGYPSQLSGGELARIAIGRALASNPNVLILDEPLSGLDRTAKLQLFELIESLQREYGFLQILVSHQSDEVAALSDQVAVLHGSPATLGPKVDLGLSGTRQWDDGNYPDVVKQLDRECEMRVAN